MTDTRQRLLNAAIESLIDTAGPGLTTGRLAAQAGVVQSAFYNHFASVEECRSAALIEVRRRLTTAASSFFAELRGPGTTTRADIESMLLDILEQATAQASIVSLIVRRCHDDEVGVLIDEVLATLRSELTATVLRNAPPQSPMTLDEAETAAAFSIAVIVSGLEQVMDGADAAATAKSAALFMISGVFAFHGISPLN